MVKIINISKKKHVLKTMKKRFLCLLLSCLMVAGLFPSAFTQAETTADDTSKTGFAANNATCSYDANTKTMTISGPEKLIWIPTESYDYVEKVVIKEGITELSLFLGKYFHGLRELTIPKSVQKINGAILQENYNLRKIYNYSSAEFVTWDSAVYAPTGWAKKGDIGRLDKIVKNASPLIWKVNGKEVSKIPAGSVATATPKTYQIQYDLKGGKKKGGSWITSYTYGSTGSLPKPTKKGYLFAGWRAEDSYVYLPTQSFTKISPIQYTDVKLTAIWRKVKVVKNKKKKTLQVRVWPKKYPQLTVVVSTEKNVKEAHRNNMDGNTVNTQSYSIAGTGKKSKTKKGMRVYNIKTLGDKKFKKGKTYYIWVKYGSVRNFEYRDTDNDGARYVTDDAYYFYKTKIKF